MDTHVTDHPCDRSLISMAAHLEAHFPVADHATVAQVAACSQCHPRVTACFLMVTHSSHGYPCGDSRAAYALRLVPHSLSHPHGLPIPTACPPAAPRQPHLRISHAGRAQPLEHFAFCPYRWSNSLSLELNKELSVVFTRS